MRRKGIHNTRMRWDRWESQWPQIGSQPFELDPQEENPARKDKAFGMLSYNDDGDEDDHDDDGEEEKEEEEAEEEEEEEEEEEDEEDPEICRSFRIGPKQSVHTPTDAARLHLSGQEFCPNPRQVKQNMWRVIPWRWGVSTNILFKSV